MSKQNTVNFKWQKQISSISQVSNLIIFHETPLTAVVAACILGEKHKLECIRGLFSFSGTWDQCQMLWEKWGFGGIPPISILWDPFPGVYSESTSLPFLEKGYRGFSKDPRCLNCGWNLLPNMTGKKVHNLSAWGTVEKRCGGHPASGAGGACAELELHLVALNQTSVSQPPSAMICGPWHKLSG